MRRPARLAAPLLLTTISCVICGAVGSASGADTPTVSGHWAAALRHENGALTERIHTATLDLYAIDAQLARAHANLRALTAQRGRIERARDSVRLRLHVTRRNARTADRRLGELVRKLYEQQSSDPLAVVLGAQSLDDAITSLDDLSRSAQTNRQIAQVSRRAKELLAQLTQKLAREDAHARALEETAARTEASLATTRGARSDLISQLTARRELNDSEIAKIDAVASASAAATTAAPVAPTAAVTAGAHAVTVTATGYAMPGQTATGLPTGWGTVAVDPSVIPLGTRMTIPGYGDGVAADTGSAVSGATIDLWFPTVQQADAWGRRLVVVTLH